MTPNPHREAGAKQTLDELLISEQRNLIDAQRTKIRELVEALKLQEAAELANANCIECEGEGDWTHCSLCSSRFGNAIDVRYALLAKLGGDTSQ
jgi:hypothetical protein